MKNETSNFVCANGSGCIRFRVKVAKKRTTASLCPHEHIVMVLSGKNVENAAVEEHANDDQDSPQKDNNWLQNTSKYLFDKKRIDLSDENIRRLEAKVMERTKSGSWLKLFQVQLKTRLYLRYQL